MSLPRGSFAGFLAAAVLVLASCGTTAPPAPEKPSAPAAPAPAEPAAAAPEPAAQPPAQASREDYSVVRRVQVLVDRGRLEGKVGAELWVTADGGQTWTNQGEIAPTGPTVPYLAPRDGRYGFIVVPIGTGGQRETTPKQGDRPERSVVVDSDPPVVELLSPNGGEFFGAGRSTVVRWIAEDPNLAPAGIRIEAATGEGNVWVPIAKDLPNTGQYHWDIAPAASSRFRLRVVAQDLAGNVGMDASDREFTVDGKAPDVRPVGPSAANMIPVPIEWAGGDVGGAGLKRVTLYVSRDLGRTWKAYGDDPDLKSPFLFKDLDGLYGIRLVAEDRMGNAAPPPAAGTPPQMTLVLDRTKPDLELTSPAGGGYHAAVPIDVTWSASDNLDMAENGIDLFYSADAGRTWKEVARGVKNDGLFKWKAPAAGAAYRLKVAARDSAGNVREAISDRFGVDEAIPEAVAVSPDGSRSHTVPVHYVVKGKGSAPIRRVTLYYRPENVKEWIKYGDDPDRTSPFQFAKADGLYDVYVTCATESGLKSEYVQKAPDAATGAQLTLRIDATPPQIHLETFAGGGFYAAGQTRDVVWKLLEPNPDRKGLRIYHSPDGGRTWSLKKGNVDPTLGTTSLDMSKFAPGNRHKIRLVLLDRYGNRGVSESQRPFTVDGDLPTVILTKRPPEYIRTGRLSLAYRAQDLTSGVKRVELHGRRADRNEAWREVARTDSARGALETDLGEEGMWEFALVAVDGSGQESVGLAGVQKADFAVGYDGTPPKIQLKGSQLPDGRRTQVNEKWEVEWTAGDAFTPTAKLKYRVEYSADGGATWYPAFPVLFNTDRADLRGHFTPGKPHRVRVIVSDLAGNEARVESEEIKLDDIPLPPLEIKGIANGDQYPAAEKVLVSWASSGRGVLSPAIEISTDGGKTWQKWADMHTKTMRLTLPAEIGRYYARMRGTDGLGRPMVSNYVSFSTVPAAEQVRIITHSTLAPSAKGRAIIRPESVVRTARKLELEIFDGKKWTKAGEIRSADVRFVAPAVPGEYRIRVLVTDADGKTYSSNQRDFRVAAASARLSLKNFRGGERVAGGKNRIIMLQTGLNPATLRVEFSSESGREGTWKPVPANTLKAAGGALFWTLPAVTTEQARIRVTGPGGASAASGSDFTIDSRSPQARVTGPGGEVAAPARLEIESQPSVTPIEALTLWVTRNDGRTWSAHKDYRDAKQVLFDPGAPGAYGVYVRARSVVGLESAKPAEGTKPQATIRIAGRRTTPPTPTPVAAGKAWKMTLPARIKGGADAPRKLSWVMPEGTGKIDLVLVVDGFDQTLVENAEAESSYAWKVPERNSRNCRLELRRGKEVYKLGPFEIDSSAPGIDSVEFEFPKR